jgi:hypothetical protein
VQRRKERREPVKVGFSRSTGRSNMLIGTVKGTRKCSGKLSMKCDKSEMFRNELILEEALSQLICSKSKRTQTTIFFPIGAIQY